MCVRAYVAPGKGPGQEVWGSSLRSQYRSVARPILRFIDAFEKRDHDYDHIVVLIPVVQPDRWYQRVFHNQLDLVLSAALRDRPELAVARLPVTMKQLQS